MENDRFEVNYYLDYCPNCKNEEQEELNADSFDQSELGGAKTRYKNNILAIKLVNQLYEENRDPTIEEKIILSKYVGWGGIPQVFDENNPSWQKEYNELKDLLSLEDYERARGSVLNAHFTSKEVIEGIYQVLTQFGVKENNKILEPAVGTGNFFLFMPNELKVNSKLYGVELDNITGRLVSKLYPKANIQITGFDKTSFPNNYFDLVVTNVPFGGYGVYDKDYTNHNFFIHDYFIAKSIDKVKPKGIVAVITTKGTLDKQNNKARKYMADRAELIGAIRLPNNAFKETAQTEVVTDILFFQKREEKIDANEENCFWLKTGKTLEGFEINNYFIQNPQMILGTFFRLEVDIVDKGSGERVRKSMMWQPTEDLPAKQLLKEAQYQAECFEEEVKRGLLDGGTVMNNYNITFYEFSLLWLEKIERDCSLVHYTRSKQIVEELKKFIGGYKVRELSPLIIQRFYDTLDERKRKVVQYKPRLEFKKKLADKDFDYHKLRYDYKIQSYTLAKALKCENVSKKWADRLCSVTQIPFDELFETIETEIPYAYETIQHYKKTIRTILAMAKKNRLIEDNYASAEYIDFPKRPKRSIKTMNDEEIQIFIEGLLHYENIKIKTALMVFILTGFRRGEVAGLDWKYNDFEKNKIQIQNTIIQITGVGCIEKGPKTEESARIITVSPSLIEQLREYQMWQEEDQKNKGDLFQTTDKVFTGEYGKNIHPSVFDKWLNIFLVDCGLPHFSLHSLRHTNIAVQLAADIPLVTVSARAGHSKPSTTSDIYAYVLKGSDTQAAQIMDTFISNRELNQENTSVNEYKRAKEEMKRLGFTSYEEYMDYLEFMKFKSRKSEKTLNIGQVE